MVTAGPCSNQENVKITNQYLVKQMHNAWENKSGLFVGLSWQDFNRNRLVFYFLYIHVTHANTELPFFKLIHLWMALAFINLGHLLNENLRTRYGNKCFEDFVHLSYFVRCEWVMYHMFIATSKLITKAFTCNSLNLSATYEEWMIYSYLLISLLYLHVWGFF